MSDTISAPSIPIQTLSWSNRIDRVKEKMEAGQLSSSSKNPAELKNACAELESLFIFYLFKEMRATIPKGGLINGGRGEEIYTSMLDSQMAKELASGQGIGLSTLFMERLAVKDGSGEEDGSKK